MAGERAANSGWNGALEFEGTLSIAFSDFFYELFLRTGFFDAHSVWIASWHPNVPHIVVGIDPSNLRGSRVTQIVYGSPHGRRACCK